MVWEKASPKRMSVRRCPSFSYCILYSMINANKDGYVMGLYIKVLFRLRPSAPKRGGDGLSDPSSAEPG